MSGDVFAYAGNLAFLALFGALGLAVRNFARDKLESAPKPKSKAKPTPKAKPKPKPKPKNKPDIEPHCYASADRVARVLAPRRLERRIDMRPVPFERRLGYPEAAGGEASDVPCQEEKEENAGVVARLVPQIPIRRDAPARSWFGGAPEMPAAMPWPKFSGKRGLFLAQICCADLPEGLWNGRGPRKGWLAFFLDPNDGAEVRALHFAERAAPRPAPAPGACCTWPLSGVLAGDADAPRRVDAFPRWPLDIVAVGPGDPDPLAPGDAHAARNRLFREGFDLAAPEHHPFSWASALALTDFALAAMARRKTLIKAALPDVEKQLARARKQIELGGMTQAMLAEMERKAEDLPKLVDGWKAAVAAVDAASEQLRAIAADVRARAETEDFSEETAAALMERLRKIELIHVERAPDPESGAEQARLIRFALTEHRPDAALFAHDYELLREDWAKHAYCAHHPLPQAQRAYFEARWRKLAAHEICGLGHAPFRGLPGFDPETQAVLVEFVSSALLKWRFGNDGTLAATIDQGALAQGDLTRLRSQISE
ncbi:hypothetical protein M2323_000309 [Rhodoblastus acidophilus]|uniref:YwqG family protein n=1 Tax=Rhodoblastus acidophilus TaxID=1074 RepID=UPI00222467CA|nr:YwqG family protein [Rhodoblastus acidophilus]MCW2282548.1 hypothetical protein [Rhodoblastus acidophilus]MCW2331409.1 hypothetical protein [Rhodoblastus acidophilus]